MKKILVSLAVMSSALVAGCSGSGGSSGNSGIDNCNADTDCPTGDVCNTAGHVCMINCASGSSACPSTEMQCATVPASAGNAGTASTTAVCQCATSALCGGGSTYCDATTDFLCEVTCSDNSGCQGYSDSTRTCVNGQCVVTVVDAGPAACTATSCTASETCNTTTGMCEAPTVCGTANTLGNCTTAGQYCDGTSCTAPAACSVTSGPAAPGANSPLIWGVVATGMTRTDSNCNANANNVVQFQGFYVNEGSGAVAVGSEMGPGATYSAISWVTASGAYGGGAAANTYLNTAITAPSSDTPGTFTFELCSPSATQAGVVLADTSGDLSNVACVSP